MRSLILETSSDCALLATVDGDAVEATYLSGGPALSKSLGAEVKKFAGQFDRIVVGTGPGSFTGMRVGGSMAQALAYGWGIPLYSVSSLTGLIPAADCAAAVDARSGGIYVQIGYNAPQRLSPAEAAETLRAIPRLFSPHPDRILARLPNLAVLEAKPDPLLLLRHAAPAAKPLALHYLA